MRTRMFAATLVLLGTTGCVPTNYRRPAPAPCTASVSPIRYTPIVAVLNFNFTYTPKDANEGRDALRDTALRELNSDGSPDGNSFTQPNGQQQNFTITYSLSNDGQDHYTGSVQLSGWGQGYISTFNRYQSSYTDPLKLTSDLTDDLYVFIHDGWHDSRPQCAPGAAQQTTAHKKKK